ncbi:hypothetical protein CNE_BB2p02790 (plasmid) [Cupriavidus necator N-1]|uniref:Uncharacterized protein n=1 Tax=Cupriavidus necator (strain ATCC 43291 / DSM 13513 / CCUG 52238 / LMG 8453 / N-1) TaxID=1042878 RepID=F8GYY6_CUPNN|nr:hypothetical protein CNE_BB2p02790 [Cupriavidus necator N-1]
MNYESGWQDAIELGRLGEKLGVHVHYRGHESIAVSSPAALVGGLSRPKLTFRQLNLYCQFELSKLPAGELERLEALSSPSACVRRCAVPVRTISGRALRRNR